jgi:hypothetical protein
VREAEDVMHKKSAHLRAVTALCRELSEIQPFDAGVAKRIVHNLWCAMDECFPGDDYGFARWLTNLKVPTASPGVGNERLDVSTWDEFVAEVRQIMELHLSKYESALANPTSERIRALASELKRIDPLDYQAVDEFKVKACSCSQKIFGGSTDYAALIMGVRFDEPQPEGVDIDDPVHRKIARWMVAVELLESIFDAMITTLRSISVGLQRPGSRRGRVRTAAPFPDAELRRLVQGEELAAERLSELRMEIKSMGSWPTIVSLAFELVCTTPETAAHLSSWLADPDTVRFANSLSRQRGGEWDIR